mmetsp:Transcript_9808/g.29881  ORF Transcript_9808/g.29881 Transcript_9808/m.29881 type:complete len:672 (-) Transcript_9808:259-2274(-)
MLTKKSRPGDRYRGYGCVVLAAGYGVRFRRSVENDVSGVFSGLLDTPKPLLPVGGRPIIAWWIDDALDAGISPENIRVVVNGKDEGVFRAALAQYNTLPMLSDKTTTAESRTGAVFAVLLAVNDLLEKSLCERVIVVAGDTLMLGTTFEEILDSHVRQSNPKGSAYAASIVGYNLRSRDDATKRGMLRLGKDDCGSELVSELVEKPKQDQISHLSRTASMPIYLFALKAVKLQLELFLEDKGNGPLEQRDAPGNFVAWLVSQGERIGLIRAQYRVDVGDLAGYKDALHLCGQNPARNMLHRRCDYAIGRALPRVSLLGNPSDGFGGSVVSLLTSSLGEAEVAMASKSPHHGFEFTCQNRPSTLGGLKDEVDSVGFPAGVQLLKAALIAFGETEYVQKHRLLYKAHGFRMSFHTSIPTMCGLAGSSALVLATLRCLCQFYGVPPESIASEREWPQLALDVETKYLQLHAGLQDRVVQVVGGVVYMKFEGPSYPARLHTFQRLNVGRLPTLFLVRYARSPSDTVHRPLRKRWDDREPAVLRIMSELDKISQAGRNLFLEGDGTHDVDRRQLADLMDATFDRRLELLGGDVLGAEVVELVDILRRYNVACNLAGSGGAIVCLSRSASQDFSGLHAEIADGLLKNAIELAPSVATSLPSLCGEQNRRQTERRASN